MNDILAAAGSTADWLARAYIDELAKAENIKTKSMLHAPVATDHLADLLGEPSVADDDAAPHLRVDLVIAAALTAKAISNEPGLAIRLRREAPIVMIETHTAELVPLVMTIVDECAAAGNRGRYILARDGSERSHSPEKGNAEVMAALNRRKLTVGVASDIKRQLPTTLQRTAEYRLALPPIDDWAIGLAIEACTGIKFDGAIEADIVRRADLIDLSLAIRGGLTPVQCLERLVNILNQKSHYSGDGPMLEDLHGYGDAMTWAKDLVADIEDYKVGRIEWDMVDNPALLLAGPPGVGKTTFAAAVAKSAGIPLIATSVAQWNSATYLSGTLQAIRDAFGQAQRNAPCILLIDEIDGISDRSTVTGDYTEYCCRS